MSVLARAESVPLEHLTEKTGGDQGESAVNGQEITHRHHPGAAHPTEITQYPGQQQKIFCACRMAAKPAQAEIADAQQSRDAGTQSQSPKQDVFEGIEVGQSAGPLPIGRPVQVSTRHRDGVLYIEQPPLIETRDQPWPMESIWVEEAKEKQGGEATDQ